MNIKLTGTLIKDVVLRFTPQGKPVADMTVSMYTGGSKEQGYKKSVFVNVTAWDELGETVNNTLKKGEKITVTGAVKEPRTYKGRDGQERQAGLEVTASDIQKGDGFDG